MNWFWLRSRRHSHVTAAGGLSHDGVGQPARRRAARRILYALLSVVIAGYCGRVHWFARQHRAGPGRHGGLAVAGVPNEC
jgi:hypothetical protein